MVAVKQTRQCPHFEPYLQLIEACTTQLDRTVTPLKRPGSFFNCTQLCLDTEVGDEATEKNKLEKITRLSQLNN